MGRFVGRWAPIVGWGLTIYDVGDLFYQGVQEIRDGALYDGRYDNTPGTIWAKKYGEREIP